MQLQQATEGDAALHVENVGGIDETAVDFPPGVTVLVGRNATNRTSLLQGVMAALGTERVSVKGGCRRGHRRARTWRGHLHAAADPP